MVLGSQIIDRPSRSPADQFTAALGNGLFVFSSRFETNTTDAPSLFVVDATNPQSLVFSNTGIPAFTADLDGFGNFVYTTSNSGLIIYQLDAVDAIPVTARVNVPKNAGIVPGSFSLEPTQIIVGADFDTLVFQLNLSAGASTRTITWQTTVANMQPGEARDLTLGTTVEFTSQGTPGQFTLPNTRVAAAQILGLTPASQTVRPGETATFDLILNNPTGVAQTFTLSVQGIPAAWVTLPTSITVPVGGTVLIAGLKIQSDPYAALSDYAFSVIATSAAGFAGSVQASLSLAGNPVIPAASPQSHGAVLTLTPQSTETGKGGHAIYTLRLTNTGSATETYHVTIAILPPNVSTSFVPFDITVPPGASNFREWRIALDVGSNANPGSYPIAFNVQSLESAASATANGSLVVLSQGVSVSLTPGQNTPGDSYMMQVTNTGAQTATFNLSLAGVGALVATLSQSQVTLAPGASALIPISTRSANFALPGIQTLAAIAQLSTNANVIAADSANLTIAATKGVIAEMAPPQQVVDNLTNTATYLVLFRNIGNVDDTYEVRILGTTGQVVATLIGIDGTPVSNTYTTTLPALATGALPLRITLTGGSTGSVTVEIRSKSDSTIVSTAQAVITNTPQQVATHLVLTVSPSTPIAGQPITLTATVTPDQLSTSLLGSVAFVVDQRTVAIVPIQNINGVFQATTTVDGLSAGTHQIGAAYSGDNVYSGTAATQPLEVIAAAPRVVRVDRFGFHARPTRLVVTFDQALDAATIAEMSNYVLRGPKGGRLAIRSVTYDAALHQITINPSRLLPLRRHYKLTLKAPAQNGLRGANGLLLDGDADGAPGGSFVAHITRASLAEPTTSRRATSPTPVAALRARNAHAPAKPSNPEHTPKATKTAAAKR